MTRPARIEILSGRTFAHDLWAVAHMTVMTVGLLFSY